MHVGGTPRALQTSNRGPVRRIIEHHLWRRIFCAGTPELVFRHAMGLEGSFSKRLGSHYRRGRTRDWLKFEKPEAPGVGGKRKRIGVADPELPIAR